MKEKTQKILTWVIIGTTILGVGAIIVKQVFFNKKPKSKFKKKAIDLANKDWKDWNEGKTKEKSSSMYNTLKQYWDNIGWDESRWTPSGVAWSSAWISYIMRKAGAGDDFKYSASHSSYIRQARKNREQNSSNPFKAYRLNEKKPELGDLVCYYRGTTSNDPFDRNSSYQSHCDIVVAKEDNKIEVIGGNVGDSVSKKVVELDDDGFVKKKGKKWFAIIKTK
jgi:hypothetical protein